MNILHQNRADFKGKAIRFVSKHYLPTTYLLGGQRQHRYQ
jgi:hypothetical protein